MDLIQESGSGDLRKASVEETSLTCSSIATQLGQLSLQSQKHQKTRHLKAPQTDRKATARGVMT